MQDVVVITARKFRQTDRRGWGCDYSKKGQTNRQMQDVVVITERKYRQMQDRVVILARKYRQMDRCRMWL